MLDFVMIATSRTRDGVKIYPKFIIGQTKDLLIRGGDFYAIWCEDRHLWSTDEQDVIRIIDNMLDEYAAEYKRKHDVTPQVAYMWDAASGSIDLWHKYVQKQMRDNAKNKDLNTKLIFSNQETSKKDYASIKLPYALEEGPMPAYEELVNTTYSPEERHKLEWSLGSVIVGDSKRIEKFVVIYGEPGTGKSTFLNIMQLILEGYWKAFDADVLGSSNNQFALEQFKSNPLVGICHDGDLSKIDKNNRLNSFTAHERMIVNEKHKSLYSMLFITFLFIATNSPVRITDGKSGLIRRLIDVRPTGNLVPVKRYNELMKQIEFELGHIAYHCKRVYEENKNYYQDYIPRNMLDETNDFYDFINDNFTIFKNDDGVSLKSAWSMYKTYVDDAKVPYPLPKRQFKNELKTYFKYYSDRIMIKGEAIRNYYYGFKVEMVMDVSKEKNDAEPTKVSAIPKWLNFKEQHSNLDDYCADCYAQYASDDGVPVKRWDNVTTKLKELDSSKLHYLKVQENHIVIDFDMKDENGNKSFALNAEAAKKFPPTYAELSKSGGGIHLHYIYTGDVSKLSRVYDNEIEVKVFTGKSSLRRKLSKCNNEPINMISSGLPLKEEIKVINFNGVKDEKHLRNILKKALNKEIHPYTKPSVDFMYKVLNDAYTSGLKYDVTDMKSETISFACNSTHQAQAALEIVNKMKFRSDDISEACDSKEAPIVFYDVEVFPNLFLVNYKFQGKDKPVIRLINPSSKEIEMLMHYRLIGFNCRRYDNHIMYSRFLGKSNEELYKQSRLIINGSKGERSGMYGEAYNISYTDILDYSTKKQSLKKWEIDLGIHHQELGLDWNQPVPEELWTKVAEYCDNDVISTEAVWEATQEDFKARQALVNIANALCPSYQSTVNDTTNTLTARLIFRGNKTPQSEFVYTNLATGERSDGSHDEHNFPSYTFDAGKSIFMGEEIGEGGYVWARQGMYGHVITLDVASMHPHTIIALNLFGPVYTKHFAELVKLRIELKHGHVKIARKMFGGALQDIIPENATKEECSAIAAALKIAINSVYGLTSAHFVNPFRDERNIDNIVAKRGALFMCQLKHEIMAMGGMPIHCKTDSIKLVNPSKEVFDYAVRKGKEYGYDFEIEHSFDRICLVNNAVYIAKLAADDPDAPGKWTATGTQFQVPYVFKKLFSKEKIEFRDLCETKEVKDTAMYLDFNENLESDDVYKKVLDLRTNGSKSKSGKYTDAEIKLLDAYKSLTDEELVAKRNASHNLSFIGRVGLFCPIKPNYG
jgi:phage/plasmid-associated DNA primase